MVVNVPEIDALFWPSVMLVLLGVALRFCLRLLYGARGPSPDDAVHLLTRILSWGLIIVPAALLLVLTINWLTLLLLAAIFTATAESLFARRANQRDAAWRLLLESRRSNRPLHQSLQLHQARFTGAVGRHYRRLAADLQNGAPWIDAVWLHRKALPREAPAYARLYQTASTIDAHAGEAAAQQDMGMRQLRQGAVQQAAYLATLALMMVAVFAFAGLRIAPSYLDVLSDFNMSTSLITGSLFRTMEIFDNPPLLISLGLGVAAALLLAGVIYIFYLCDRPILRPVTDRIGFARHQASFLRLLALAVAQEIPISEALAQLASGRGAYSARVVRRRIAAAGERIGRGVDWPTALEKSSLIDAGDVAPLRAAQEVGNLPWVMRLLADRKLSAMAARWSVALQLAFTVAILLMAAVVFWFAVAMFVPIVDIIWNLA